MSDINPNERETPDARQLYNCWLLQSATADGEVGHYQLLAAHVDGNGGTTETLYRIDTTTGETGAVSGPAD